jgi:hypothetical protein
MSCALSSEVARSFRDELRNARALALQDGERFTDVLFAIKRLGSFLIKEIAGLSNYERALTCLARESPLADYSSGNGTQGRSKFSALFEVLRMGRNDALH